MGGLSIKKNGRFGIILYIYSFLFFSFLLVSSFGSIWEISNTVTQMTGQKIVLKSHTKQAYILLTYSERGKRHNAS
jgi:hypothetical protein